MRGFTGFQPSIEEPPEVVGPAMKQGKRTWPLDVYGRALGLPRIGLPHLSQIASWALEDGNKVPLYDGGLVIAGYLDIPEKVVEHTAFFRRALEIAEYVDEETPGSEVVSKIKELHEGWMQNAPSSLEEVIKNHPDDKSKEPKIPLAIDSMTRYSS